MGVTATAGIDGRARPAFGRVAGTRAAVLIATWIAVCAVTAILKPGFVSSDAYVAIAFTLATSGLLAIGQLIVIAGGGLLDLSLATIAGCAASLMAWMSQSGTAWPLILLACVAGGAAYGTINALVVVGLGINPIVATLGTNFIGSGILGALVDARTVPTDAPLREFAVSRVLGTPVPALIVVVAIVLTGLYMANTRTGQHILAAGGDPTATEARGIDLARLRLATFVFAGACGGAAGVILGASTGQVTAGIGKLYQFPIIVIAVLGGASLLGGRISLTGLFAALLLMSTIPTALVVLGLATAWVFIVQGLILAIALAVDGIRVRRTGGT